MKYTILSPSDIAKTFTLIARPDTHYFIKHELPAYMASLQKETLPFRNYITSLRSGEYIAKASYSDAETDYIYLTVGQFSGEEVAFQELTFLDPTIGKEYEYLKLTSGDLIVTRSGTVGVVHIFQAPDNKTYIPSHHLAVVSVADAHRALLDYFRLILQADFAKRFFWAFATGKGQKEISNWSIKNIPIPQIAEPLKLLEKAKQIEHDILSLRKSITDKAKEKDLLILEAIASR